MSVYICRQEAIRQWLSLQNQGIISSEGYYRTVAMYPGLTIKDYDEYSDSRNVKTTVVSRTGE